MSAFFLLGCGVILSILFLLLEHLYNKVQLTSEPQLYCTTTGPAALSVRQSLWRLQVVQPALPLRGQGYQVRQAERQTSMLLVCRGEKAEDENGEEELSCEQEMERTEVELAAARRQILALERQLSAVTNSEESEPSR